MQKIILLHGAIGCSEQLMPLSKSLTDTGFETFTFNFSGHGKSNFKSNFSIEQFSDELHNFITENNLIKPNIFGYSMGGYVACTSPKNNLNY